MAGDTGSDKKNRFQDMKALQQAVSGAALTAAQGKKEKPAEKINRMIYNIDPDLFAAIENSSESLSGFAKRAMEKLAREEGKI